MPISGSAVAHVTLVLINGSAVGCVSSQAARCPSVAVPWHVLLRSRAAQCPLFPGNTAPATSMAADQAHVMLSCQGPRTVSNPVLLPAVAVSAWPLAQDNSELPGALLPL